VLLSNWSETTSRFDFEHEGREGSEETASGTLCCLGELLFSSLCSNREVVLGYVLSHCCPSHDIATGIQRCGVRDNHPVCLISWCYESVRHNQRSVTASAP
jgi:hypothetical protein